MAKNFPVLSRGDTLTSPKYGLPAIRGQSSSEVIYQQSIANGSGINPENAATYNITVSDTDSAVSDDEWIKVINPDGEGYKKGIYETISITVIDANKENGAGYKAIQDDVNSSNYNKYIGDTWITEGIIVEPLDEDVLMYSRFRFADGQVLVASRDHNKGEERFYGKLLGTGSLRHNNVGTSGGIVVAGSNHQHFNQKLKNEVKPDKITGNWYFKDDRVGKIKLKEGLPKTLDVGDIVEFPHGKIKIIKTAEKGITELKGKSYNSEYRHYEIMQEESNDVAFKNGQIGKVWESKTTNSNALQIKDGYTFRFSNGAEFTVSKQPSRGEIALAGELSGDVSNGSVNVREITVNLSTPTKRSFEKGESFYFPGSVLVLTEDVGESSSEIKGILSKSIADANLKNEKGFNASYWINQTESVKLIDPTREKVSHYIKIDGETFPPSSVNTSYYQGKIFFPALPPHLSKRVFIDPNRGKYGALVVQGKFMDEPVGEKYLQLNVLSQSNYMDLINLCNSADPAFSSWKSLVKGLTTEMDHFKAKIGPDGNTPIKGVYERDPNNSYIRNISEVAEVYSSDVAVDSYALSATGPGTGYVSIVVGNGLNENIQPIGEPVTVHIIKVNNILHPGSIKVVQAENPLDERTTFYHSPDLAGKVDEFDYQWRKSYPVDGTYPDFYENPREDDDGVDINTPGDQWLLAESNSDGTGKNIFVLGEKPGVDTLMDMYISMRYKLKGSADWSNWSKPQLAEGWIKRVLAGINPFNQRVKDLFNNQANLDYSMLTQAGGRWEGDVALSLSSINDFGLIEIYETVLNKAKNLSIGAGINHNGANQALLLAAGYLNDLYMMVGNDAFADAYNPTIGFATSDASEYSDFSTSLFSFKGQLPTLLEEELALLRGRDDFKAPGVEANPVYNRLFWNYTRGIDSGEVIYALNYNIQERDGIDLDGNIDAADAQHMYPMGHGDAYGHYMTALKGYYKLLSDNDFTWVPQSESVLILGQEVAVDYMDERKFAAAASALGRAGNQVLELTWRRDYLPGKDNGWVHLGSEKENDRRSYKTVDVILDKDGNQVDKINTKRHWGVDHWASRVGQGNYINWIVGNAIVPSVDDDPSHEGIQKVDRTTVTELLELPELAKQIQQTIDNAAAGLNPLGLPENSVAFDIDPTFMEVGSGIQGETHFDQIYKRAVSALENAASAFETSKGITSTMRQEEDSAADLAVEVSEQELAYKYQLIELYGTPYPEDIGPGKLYKQGYDGPDLLNHSYIDYPRLPKSDAAMSEEHSNTRTLRIYIEKLFDTSYSDQEIADGLIGKEVEKIIPGDPQKAFNYVFNILKSEGSSGLKKGVHYVEYELDDTGLLNKPISYVGKRSSPGQLQTAAHNVVSSHSKIINESRKLAELKRKLDLQVILLNSLISTKSDIETYQDTINTKTRIALGVKMASDTVTGIVDPVVAMIDRSYGGVF